MSIDRDLALSAPPVVGEARWTTRDVLLYHLSVGAGAGAPQRPDLHLTHERSLAGVLPTFALVAGTGISAGELEPETFGAPGVELDLRRLLYGAQSLTVHQPLPVSGRASVGSRVVEVWDKGEAAVVVVETQAVLPDGSPLWSATKQLFARGEGGFGGPRGPKVSWQPPDRDPDLVLETSTRGDQALLYRLNGDDNPLHVDPAFARSSGFDRPILHGLATFGIVARTLVDGVLDGDPARLIGLSARFARPLTPGETLRTLMWADHAEPTRLALTVTCAERDDAPVLTRAEATLRPA